MKGRPFCSANGPAAQWHCESTVFVPSGLYKVRRLPPSVCHRPGDMSIPTRNSPSWSMLAGVARGVDDVGADTARVPPCTMTGASSFAHATQTKTRRQTIPLLTGRTLPRRGSLMFAGGRCRRARRASTPAYGRMAQHAASGDITRLCLGEIRTLSAAMTTTPTDLANVPVPGLRWHRRPPGWPPTRRRHRSR